MVIIERQKDIPYAVYGSSLKQFMVDKKYIAHRVSDNSWDVISWDGNGLIINRVIFSETDNVHDILQAEFG